MRSGVFSHSHRVAALLVTIGTIGCGGSGGGGTTGAAVAPTTSTAPVTSPGPVTPPTPVTSPVAPVGTWLKGDLHVHSTYSHDAQKLGDDIATVIKLGERAGLDFLSISDHRTVDCLADPGFTNAKTSLVLLAGEEWGGPGHAGAHGLTRAPIFHEQDQSQGPAVCVQKIQQAIDDVRAMGGFFVLNHAMDDRCPWLWPVASFDGMEVWNQSWAFRCTVEMDAADIAAWSATHGPALPEASAAAAAKGGGINWQRLKLYEAFLASGRHIAAVGGGDTHYLSPPGGPTTLVYAKDRTPAAIVEGVRKGRTMVARSPSAPEVELAADRDGDGVFESILGDSIPLGRAVTFKIRVRGGEKGKLDLVRNGRVVESWIASSQDFVVTWKDAPASRTWYRVDLYEPLDLSTSEARSLRDLVRAKSTAPWLSVVATGALSTAFGGKLGQFASKVQDFIDAGGPGAIGLILHGSKLGVTVAPVPGNFPRLEFPDRVNRILNVALHDDERCMSVVTSPIWIE